jgi:hypothetical protein
MFLMQIQELEQLLSRYSQLLSQEFKYSNQQIRFIMSVFIIILQNIHSIVQVKIKFLDDFWLNCVQLLLEFEFLKHLN